MRMLVLGAGKMAKAIAYDFVRQIDVEEVVIASRKISSVAPILKFLKSKKAKFKQLDVTNEREVVKIMKNFDVAVSAVPYVFNYKLAKAAVRAGCSFVDLGGNNDIVKKEFGLSKEAKKKGISIVPDSGLAPGLVSNLTALGLKDFDGKVDKIHLRVGGLPQNPKGDLQYMLVFSVKGLINEYIEPSIGLDNYKITKVPSMTDVEKIYFKGFGTMEAFFTSGGTSTLPQSFKGKIKHLDYKTIRYPGHAEKIRLLMNLGLTESKPHCFKGGKVAPREILEHLLKENYAYKDKDLVLLKVILENKKKRVTYELIDYETKGLTAMMRCTGFPAATIALMIGRGQVKKKGTLKHEFDIPTHILYQKLKKKGLNIVKRTTQIR